MFHVKQSPFLEALAAATADLSLPAGALERMAEHWALVKAWNERVNLTSVTDDVEAAWRHYRDSLEALRLLPPGAIVDLGTGPGYPGIPLALASPERTFTLVEPRRKRVSFLEVALIRLKLTNARALYGSSTDPPDRAYAAAVTRATFSAAEEIAECLAWVEPGGIVVAYRSDPSGLAGTQVHPYAIRNHARVLEVWTKPR
jgi:16S rRNA (guanine527-N7)-methyltransferase